MSSLREEVWSERSKREAQLVTSFTFRSWGEERNLKSVLGRNSQLDGKPEESGSQRRWEERF